MLDDRDYMRRRRRFEPHWSVTTVLIVLNVAVFVIQNLVDRLYGFSIYKDFALSVDGLKAGHVWQLITFQFLHAPLNDGGIFHILGNLFAIYMVGPPVEEAVGRSGF